MANEDLQKGNREPSRYPDGAKAESHETTDRDGSKRDVEELVARVKEKQRFERANQICGKYAFVPASSEEFAVAKPEEIALEDLPG